MTFRTAAGAAAARLRRACETSALTLLGLAGMFRRAEPMPKARRIEPPLTRFSLRPPS